MLFSQELTDQSLEVLRSAVEEATARNHRKVTRLHVLSALIERVDADDVAAAKILGASTNPEELSAAVEEGLAKVRSQSNGSPAMYSDELYIVLGYASHLAAAAGHALATSDILLGIMWDGGEPILRKAGLALDRATAIAADAHRVETRKGDTAAMLAYRSTTGASRVPAFAHFLAREAGAPGVGTHHLLLALFTERDGLARRLLEAYGIQFADLRARVFALDSTGTSDDEGYQPYMYRDKPPF